MHPWKYIFSAVEKHCRLGLLSQILKSLIKFRLQKFNFHIYTSASLTAPPLEVLWRRALKGWCYISDHHLPRPKMFYMANMLFHLSVSPIFKPKILIQYLQHLIPFRAEVDILVQYIYVYIIDPGRAFLSSNNVFSHPPYLF